MITTKVAILGGGSFGTALGNIVAHNGYEVTLWMRDEAQVEQCRETRRNIKYLPDYPLHDALNFSSDLRAAVVDANLVVLAVPSGSFRAVARSVAPLIQKGCTVVSSTKGIEAGTFSLMSEILTEELVEVKIGVLSGPNFAKEIAEGHYTGCVAASDHDDVLETLQRVFSSGTFRVYRNHDRKGVELAGVLKNIYAMVTGLADALGTGKNTQAMLLTRSLAEMGRFSQVLGADPLTILGLAGVGDLVLTCTSDQSRNYRVGFAIGQGRSLDEILDELGQVAEGVNTLKTVRQKSEELGIYMPLVQGLHAILFENQDIGQVVTRLMTGEMSNDVDLQGGN